MEESTVYQSIFAKGEARGEARAKARAEAEGFLEGQIIATRLCLIRLGERRFGRSSVWDRDLVEEIKRLDRLEQLLDLAFESQATTWIEFWVTVIGGNPLS